MSEIVDFLKENSQMIILIVIVVLGLLVLINMKGIDLNPPKPDSKLVQEVTVETLDMMDKILSNEKINVNVLTHLERRRPGVEPAPEMAGLQRPAEVQGLHRQLWCEVLDVLCFQSPNQLSMCVHCPATGCICPIGSWHCRCWRPVYLTASFPNASCVIQKRSVIAAHLL